MKTIDNGDWDGQPITRDQTAGEKLAEILFNEQSKKMEEINWLEKIEEENDPEVKANMIGELSPAERSNYYRTHPDMEDGDFINDNLEDR